MMRDARWNINTYNHNPRQLYAVPKTDQPSVRSQNARASNEPRTVQVVSERLGHESPAFTLKQYAHVIPGMQAAAAAAVAALAKAQSEVDPEAA